MKLKLAVQSINSTRRRKHHTIRDLCSYIGGLLGLFAGFSFLSGFEVIYYFLVGPMIDMISGNESRTNVETKIEQLPQKISKNSKFIEIVKKLFRNSSIHSFNHIGRERTSFFVRY